jgi:hypothetical protein
VSNNIRLEKRLSFYLCRHFVMFDTHAVISSSMGRVYHPNYLMETVACCIWKIFVETTPVLEQKACTAFKLPYVLQFMTSLLLFVQQVHDYLNDELEAFHFLLNRTTHTGICKAHGATDIDRLASSPREYFRKPCCKVERCAVGKEWCAEWLARCGHLSCQVS